MRVLLGNPNRPATIVTGGSRGIGAATAVHLARAGHDIVVNYRSDQAAAERIVQMATAEGARAVSVRADVTQEDEVARLFALAQEQLGTVTGLVNNAGVTAHIGDLADTPVISSAAATLVRRTSTSTTPQPRRESTPSRSG
jgi:NAD(P)-dependent dehydrogenase (short-subunit alcohol dehydrogenase family)